MRSANEKLNEQYSVRIEKQSGGRFRWSFARPAENTESRKIVDAQVAAYVAFSENVCVVTPETVLIPDDSSGVGPTLELRRE
jgi:hypothetical protein